MRPHATPCSPRHVTWPGQPERAGRQRPHLPRTQLLARAAVLPGWERSSSPPSVRLLLRLSLYSGGLSHSHRLAAPLAPVRAVEGLSHPPSLAPPSRPEAHAHAHAH
eukprot:2150945-Prymnesium_polylepis.1